MKEIGNSLELLYLKGQGGNPGSLLGYQTPLNMGSYPNRPKEGALCEASQLGLLGKAG